VVENDTPQQAISLLGQGGTYSIVGYGAQLGFATMEMILKELTVVSTMVGNYADLSELMALVIRDRVKLETKRYALEDAVAALDDLDNGRIRGRAVLTPGARS
jgi:NAD+-dependent secondary alcohol dehydrogenase Adh1